MARMLRLRRRSSPTTAGTERHQRPRNNHSSPPSVSASTIRVTHLNQHMVGMVLNPSLSPTSTPRARPLRRQTTTTPAGVKRKTPRVARMANSLQRPQVILRPSRSLTQRVELRLTTMCRQRRLVQVLMARLRRLMRRRRLQHTRHSLRQMSRCHRRGLHREPLSFRLRLVRVPLPRMLRARWCLPLHHRLLHLVPTRIRCKVPARCHLRVRPQWYQGHRRLHLVRRQWLRVRHR